MKKQLQASLPFIDRPPASMFTFSSWQPQQTFFFASFDRQSKNVSIRMYNSKGQEVVKKSVQFPAFTFQIKSTSKFLIGLSQFHTQIVILNVYDQFPSFSCTKIEENQRNDQLKGNFSQTVLYDLFTLFYYDRYTNLIFGIRNHKQIFYFLMKGGMMEMRSSTNDNKNNGFITNTLVTKRLLTTVESLDKLQIDSKGEIYLQIKQENSIRVIEIDWNSNDKILNNQKHQDVVDFCVREGWDLMITKKKAQVGMRKPKQDRLSKIKVKQLDEYPIYCLNTKTPTQVQTSFALSDNYVIYAFPANLTLIDAQSEMFFSIGGAHPSEIVIENSQCKNFPKNLTLNNSMLHLSKLENRYMQIQMHKFNLNQLCFGKNIKIISLFEMDQEKQIQFWLQRNIGNVFGPNGLIDPQYFELVKKWNNSISNSTKETTSNASKYYKHNQQQRNANNTNQNRNNEELQPNSGQLQALSRKLLRKLVISNESKVEIVLSKVLSEISNSAKMMKGNRNSAQKQRHQASITSILSMWYQHINKFVCDIVQRLKYLLLYKNADHQQHQQGQSNAKKGAKIEHKPQQQPSKQPFNTNEYSLQRDETDWIGMLIHDNFNSSQCSSSQQQSAPQSQQSLQRSSLHGGLSRSSRSSLSSSPPSSPSSIDNILSFCSMFLAHLINHVKQEQIIHNNNQNNQNNQNNYQQHQLYGKSNESYFSNSQQHRDQSSQSLSNNNSSTRNFMNLQIQNLLNKMNKLQRVSDATRLVINSFAALYSIYNNNGRKQQQQQKQPLSSLRSSQLQSPLGSIIIESLQDIVLSIQKEFQNRRNVNQHWLLKQKVSLPQPLQSRKNRKQSKGTQRPQYYFTQSIPPLFIFQHFERASILPLSHQYSRYHVSRTQVERQKEQSVQNSSKSKQLTLQFVEFMLLNLDKYEETAYVCYLLTQQFGPASPSTTNNPNPNKLYPTRSVNTAACNLNISAPLKQFFKFVEQVPVTPHKIPFMNIQIPSSGLKKHQTTTISSSIISQKQQQKLSNINSNSDKLRQAISQLVCKSIQIGYFPFMKYAAQLCVYYKESKLLSMLMHSDRFNVRSYWRESFLKGNYHAETELVKFNNFVVEALVSTKQFKEIFSFQDLVVDKKEMQKKENSQNERDEHGNRQEHGKGQGHINVKKQGNYLKQQKRKKCALPVSDNILKKLVSELVKTRQIAILMKIRLICSSSNSENGEENNYPNKDYESPINTMQSQSLVVQNTIKEELGPQLYKDFQKMCNVKPKMLL